VPLQAVVPRCTATPTEEPPIGNDMMLPATSSSPAFLNGHSTGLLGWKGGTKVIAHPPVAPGAPFISFSWALLYGLSEPENASVRQLAALMPAPDPVALAASAAG